MFEELLFNIYISMLFLHFVDAHLSYVCGVHILPGILKSVWMISVH